jgi:hypothetical protein
MITPPRAQFRQALAALADKARSALPDLNGRVDAAVKLVLAGDVELLPDGTGEVFSTTNPALKYRVNGSCPCPDFSRAPSNFCKHRLALVFARRTQATQLPRDTSDPHTTLHTASPDPDATSTLLEASSAGAQQAPVATLPEAPASVNVRLMLHGRECQLTLRDSSEERLLARLATVLARFPVETPALVQTATASQPPVCPRHGTMKESTKAKGTWYCPAKMGDGSFCKERWPAKGR